MLRSSFRILRPNGMGGDEAAYTEDKWPMTMQIAPMVHFINYIYIWLCVTAAWNWSGSIYTWEKGICTKLSFPRTFSDNINISWKLYLIYCCKFLPSQSSASTWSCCVFRMCWCSNVRTTWRLNQFIETPENMLITLRGALWKGSFYLTFILILMAN